MIKIPLTNVQTKTDCNHHMQQTVLNPLVCNSPETPLENNLKDMRLPTSVFALIINSGSTDANAR